MRRSSSGASHASLPRGGQGGGDDTTAGNGGHGVLGGATAGAGTVEDGSSPLLAASTPQSGRQLHVVSPGDDNEDADLLKAGALRGYASPPTRRMNAFMVTLTGMCAIGGLLFGWDTGVVSAAVLVLRDDYSMTDLQVEVCSMAGVQWLRRWYGWGGGWQRRYAVRTSAHCALLHVHTVPGQLDSCCRNRQRGRGCSPDQRVRQAASDSGIIGHVCRWCPVHGLRQRAGHAHGRPHHRRHRHWHVVHGWAHVHRRMCGARVPRHARHGAWAAASPWHRPVVVVMLQRVCVSRPVQVNNLFITGGQFLASIVDGAFANVPHGWRYMLGLSGIPAFVMVCPPRRRGCA